MTLDFFLNLKPDLKLEGEAVQRKHKTGRIPSYGTLPALVPGMVDAALLALRDFGTLSFGDVAAPATDLAAEHPIDRTRVRSIREAASFLSLYPSSRSVFAPQGRFPTVGELFRQHDLESTIRAMARAEREALADGKARAAAIDAVRDYFYRGPIAREIVDFVEEDGGLLRFEDFDSFRLEVERPLKTTFHGYGVYKAGFWTQGAVLLQALNLLEGFDLQGMGWNTPAYLHHLVESLKLAFADRDSWYADPEFSDVPEELLQKDYATGRRALIHPRRSSKGFRPGVIRQPEARPSRRPGGSDSASPRQAGLEGHDIDQYRYRRRHDVLGLSFRCLDAFCDRREDGDSTDPAGAQLPDDRRPSQCRGARQASEDHVNPDSCNQGRRAIHGAVNPGRGSAGTGPAAGAARGRAVQFQSTSCRGGTALSEQALGGQFRRPRHGAERAAA